MLRFRLIVMIAGLVLATLLTVPGVLHAEEINPGPPPDADVSASDDSAPDVVLGDALPASARLEGLSMVWQDVNRCASAALTIQMSYWVEERLNYRDTISFLNPYNDDMSVRLDEMVAYAETFGLRGIERSGGTIDLLRTLVANGFPVLVENAYYDGGNVMFDWMSHNRVIMGYDDNLREFYAFDSLLGAGENNQGRPFDYDDLDERWRTLNRYYMVIYEPEDEARLQAVMGDLWDPVKAAEWTLEQARADMAEGRDSFDLFNEGMALVMLGRYEEAAASFDESRRVGLPWRMMWYQFEPYEAYLQLGRYDDVIALTRQVVADAPGIEESYYYIARAYLALGDTQRAINNLDAALWRNPRYAAARELRDSLEGEDTG
jgi:tetratricopeptide (TPR) repeat protein